MNASAGTGLTLALGQVIITPTAAAALKQHGLSSEEVLCRHRQGDWGDISSEQQQINVDGLQEHRTIESVYDLGGDRIVIVTKADRSATYIHLDRRRS